MNLPDDRTGVEIAPGIVLKPGILRFSFSRSGGPGGQNVNKVNTRAELRIAVSDLVAPGALSEDQATRLRKLAGRRLNNRDELVVASSRYRSQLRNRQDCLGRLRLLILRAVAPRPIRRPTTPSRASIRRRLETKHRRSTVKRTRRRPSNDEQEA